jgi:hypothetical protein
MLLWGENIVERLRFVLHYRETLFLGLLTNWRKSKCGWWTYMGYAIPLLSAWFQQNGVRTHTSSTLHRVLLHIFEERALSTWYPALFEEGFSWPSISPDLNHYDYFLVYSVCYRNEDSQSSVSGVDRYLNKNKTNSVALVRKRTIPTKRPPLVGEVSANFSG